jgi:hypothetical protein
MDFEKDLRLARDLVRCCAKAYGEIVLEHLKGSDFGTPER